MQAIDAQGDYVRFNIMGIGSRLRFAHVRGRKRRGGGARGIGGRNARQHRCEASTRRHGSAKNNSTE